MLVSFMTVSALGVVLAGGQATRMEGKAKGLMAFKGALLCEYAIKALSPVCDDIVVNANYQIEEYEVFAPVLSDMECIQSRGPLSGVYSALDFASVNGFTHLIISPCDTPYVGNDVFAKLKELAEINSEKILYIKSESGRQPLHAIIPVGMSEQLKTFLNQGNNKVMDFYNEQDNQSVSWQHDVFSNINYLDQLL